MQLSDQVCALEYSKKLAELGIKQESLFYWVRPIDEWQLTCVFSDEDKAYFDHATNDILPMEYYSAFTVAELFELLPEWLEHPDEDDQMVNLCLEKSCLYTVSYGFIGQYKSFDDKNPANALAKMLIALYEQGLMKVKE